MADIEIYSMSGERIAVAPVGPATKAQDVMKDLEQSSGVSVAFQRLVFQGRVLQADDVLLEQGVGPEEPLMLMSVMPSPEQLSLEALDSDEGMDAATLRYLLHCRADHDQVWFSGARRVRPVIASASWGHDLCLGVLLEARASPEQLSNSYSHDLPLVAAAASGNEGCVSVLLAARADARLPSRHGAPLLAAASNGRTACVRVLLEARVEPDPPGRSPNPLLAAVGRRRNYLSRTPIDEEAYISCVRLLLEAQADPNRRSGDSLFRDGDFPLLVAAVGRHHDCFELLLEVRAEPQQLLLRVADLRDRGPTFAQLLLRARADPNEADPLSGARPLWAAAHRGHEQCVRELLDGRADPNLPNTNTGSTAVEQADWGRHESCVELLLASRAETSRLGEDAFTSLSAW